jgi:hypothetical protein
MKRVVVNKNLGMKGQEAMWSPALIEVFGKFKPILLKRKLTKAKANGFLSPGSFNIRVCQKLLMKTFKKHNHH